MLHKRSPLLGATAFWKISDSTTEKKIPEKFITYDIRIPNSSVSSLISGSFNLHDHWTLAAKHFIYTLDFLRFRVTVYFLAWLSNYHNVCIQLANKLTCHINTRASTPAENRWRSSQHATGVGRKGPISYNIAVPYYALHIMIYTNLIIYLLG